jgi:hypothetical protein
MESCISLHYTSSFVGIHSTLDISSKEVLTKLSYMKNKLIYILITIIIGYGLWSSLNYENQIKELQEIHLMERDSLKTVIDSINHEIDSLNHRYEIFDNEPGREFIDILNAIVIVESQGDPTAYAPSEDAVGILQIRKVLVDDVNRILKRKGSFFRYTYNDRWDVDKSFEMFDIYCDYYNLETAEEMARGWNGGPRGINNPATEIYWAKVLNELSS